MMGKHDDIDQLRHDLFMLARRVEHLENQVKQLPSPSERQKVIEQNQDDWAKRNLGILNKGPLPYAHKTGHAGNMTTGGSQDD